MRIVTFTGNVYETDKIEFGGWDEKHEKYSHDRVVFFDLEAEEWVNMECAVIVCVIPDAPAQEDIDEPEEDPEDECEQEQPTKEEQHDSMICDDDMRDTCVGDCDLCDQEPSKNSGGVPKSKIDHGRIVALYTARPPRSVSWIADDLGCAVQTVINHLKAEGIYRGKK